VRDVVKGTPAHLSSFGFRPGDVVLAVDGVAVAPGDDPTVALNGPAGREVTLTLAPRPSAKPGAKETRVRMKTASFGAVREKVGAEQLRAVREYVHAKSGGKLGYINIDAMDMPSFWLFQKEMFSEGCGREGLIIDVRDNGGGNTADKVLSILVGANHARVHSRGFSLSETGYPLYRWERPLWSRPIVVMCNEDSASNAEILTHAVKAMKRGRVVGMPTGGNVISTWSRSLLDLGTLRDPHRGWYTPDGTDMEWNGAVPDVIVKNNPADLVRGVDAQLDVAIRTLSEDVARAKASSHPVVCRPVR
jgi:tricorn protease